MELKETVEMMNSADYKERFKAEYFQLKIRRDKLKAMTDKWDRGELNFQPTCPRDWYDAQLHAMDDYLFILGKRATLEHVSLEG